MTRHSLATPGCHHEHAAILGVAVSAVNMRVSIGIADRWIAAGRPGYVCACGVHGVMEALRSPALRTVLNRAVMNVPDGMPMTWAGRLLGHGEMDRVFGPDFMYALCELSRERGYRHFLYGGQPGVAQELKEVLERKFPGLHVVDIYTPPFRPLNADEELELFERVEISRPHIVWVGLSTPKQEHFMARYVDRLRVPLLVGVGAAFDYHTGRIRDCAPWIKRAGLQWLHRLFQDPKRLWHRYLRNNPAFVWEIALQLLKLRHYSVTLDSPGPDLATQRKVRP